MRHLVTSLCIACYCAVFFSAQPLSAKTDENLKLWYDTPAIRWEEALPVGNGRLGAMIFGDPTSEKIQLNEETVWAGKPNNNINPSALNALPSVRKLMFEKKWRDAQRLVNAKIMTRTNQGMPYQPVGDLHISFPGHKTFSNFYRDLSLNNAIATTRYTANGVDYSREVFAAFNGNVIVVRLTASKKASLNFSAWLSSPHKKKSILVENNTLFLRATPPEFEKLESKINFTTAAKIIIEGGKIETKENTQEITNADSATIYISIGTNFVNYKDISADADVRAKNWLAEAIQKGLPQLRAEHIQHYKRLFDRVHIDLGETESIKKPTDTRVLEFSKTNDPQLVSLYFQFGRYLLISSAQPGGQPPNLQGIWNPHLNPPWDSKYTTNINAEMNHWPAEVTNLPEMHESFVQLIKETAVTGTETAKLMYGTRGWVLHHNTDIWRLTGPIDRAESGMWPTGGAWLCQHLWDRYLYSGDKEYLRDIYPVLKGAALFILDFLIEEPESKHLVISPSNSPENGFMGNITNTYGVTMDNQLAFELFTNVISAAKILEEDSAFSQELLRARNRLSPHRIGKHSQLQEWFFDWDNPRDKHRHVSHLYGLYPSWQISPYRTPEIFDAARNSLNYRGDPATGWSMGWKVCFWARFLDGDRALKLIREQLKLTGKPEKTKHRGGGTYPNLFDAHPPFQIDGNFGCTAGIAEMLMQSHDEAVHILPALPKSWNAGKITGLRARGGFQIEEITWENGAIKTLKIKSTLGGNLRLRTQTKIVSVATGDLKLANGKNPNPFFQLPEIPKPIISPNAKLKPPSVQETLLFDVPTEAGKTYSFSAK
ncbi:MAG: glycoside hydrolase family 95 protein [Puniceicoccales bacterium]|jgi:alpha-L-fucosidase 2|nr:glycoside hydrolase family 95 protein [Puniceicoccales bacterium]